MQKNFSQTTVTGCSSDRAGAFGPTQDLNPCLLCLLHGQSGSLPLALLGKPKYHNGNLYLWLRAHKTYAILSPLQECDVTRVGVITTYKPKNWGSSASFIHQPPVTQRLAGPGYKFVSSLQGSVQSLEPSLFTPAWTVCWTVHWVWFSELDCRMEGCSLKHRLQEWHISERLSAEEWLNKWQAIHSGNSTQLLKRMR